MHGEDGPTQVPVKKASTDPGQIEDVEEVVVVAPLLGHESLLAWLSPHLRSGHRLLFIGEGGGALRALASLPLEPAGIAEFNTLPYLARVEGPGRVMVRPKQGGVYVAAADPGSTPRWLESARATWPWADGAETVLDTVLANYNVIDHVPTVLANAGYLESGSGPWALWGEGCTPAVGRAIAALDDDLRHIRSTLGMVDRRYAQCLVDQGFAPPPAQDVYSTIHKSVLSGVMVERSDSFLEGRFVMEDVPHALVLIESIARIYGVETPYISALITFAAALVGADVRAAGTTVASLGLPTDPAGFDRLVGRA
jgi:opine dehydrogenase